MEKNLAFEIVKKHGILIALSLVMFLSITDIFFVYTSESKLEKLDSKKTEMVCKSSGDKIEKNIPKLSQITKPSITKESASSKCSLENISACKDLGQKAWLIVLVSFVALLIFNLTHGFLKNNQIQWGWETLMTTAFISFWFIFDECAQNLWYPLYIIKIAIAIYVIYLYFFLKKKENVSFL